MNKAGTDEDTDEVCDVATACPDDEQTAEQFFVRFRSEQQGIEQAMAALTAGTDHVHEVLDALLMRAQALEALFIRSSHLLPKYDLQQYRSTLKALTTSIGARREELAPRKKFSFKRREPVAKISKAAREEATLAMQSDASGPRVTGAAVIKASSNELFEGLQDVCIAKDSGDIAGKDVSLKTLTGCRVVLLDHVGALHCHGLRHCELIVGSIESSALLYDCHECIITLAAKQLRLHDSERISLRLFTLSGPVIEHSHHILVSPYNLTYPGVESHWTAASLGVPAPAIRELGAWAEVQDFNWHKRQASPNWCIMPENSWPAKLEINDASSFSPLAPLPPSLDELECCHTCFQKV